jgi:diguanylate cyclase (GGDEF)-like protein
MDRLERAALRHRRTPQTTCLVLFLDIDRFKLVNDTFSHAVGDRLLTSLAARVTHQLGPGDTLARLAGDEFTILMEDVPVSEAESTAVEVAIRVQRALDEEFEIAGHHFFVSASTGIAIASADESAADLLRNADIAMYEAKHRGTHRYAIFDGSMHQRISDRLAKEHDLRLVIEKQLIDVHYQPVVDLTTGRISAFEALARWPRSIAGMEPSEFIPLAEESGLIGPLGRHVMKTSLATLAEWRRAGVVGEDVRVSVNVSGRQLDDPHFPDEVLACLRATGIEGRALHLEITEGTLMREPERMERIVAELCSVGVGLELDDFGTGYSSLAALHRFPVDALKIDRGFVEAIETEGGPIIRSTVALGHGLGLKVIAEGIETQTQLEELRRLGCEFGQGYLLSPPRPAGEIADLVRDWSPEAILSPA